MSIQYNQEKQNTSPLTKAQKIFSQKYMKNIYFRHIRLHSNPKG